MLKGYATRPGRRLANTEGVSEDALRRALCEIECGLIDADLGGGLIKKRVGRPGQGKRGGVRCFFAYAPHDRAVLLYVLSKSDRKNIRKDEEEALKKLAKQYLTFSDRDLQHAVASGALVTLSSKDSSVT
ncbi:type II toxin-antitoxin system RelE/ParE family toxin [Roseospira navarrensis]|uniref:type II toxin-antitoxin system RelE/ParE family toxin n=1 Tax=Roseospira navarrensis TaxID=140058 RepID=UPI0014787CEA|nr:type II toxin-antitoxin system RelE/ParE family toxin [Roseospira navarrensis]